MTARLPTPEFRTCSKCREEKAICEFGRDRTQSGGFSYSCKACVKAYREANRHLASARMRRWRAANPERVKEARRQSYAADPDRHRAYVRKYRLRYPELTLENDRNYKAANKDNVRATNKRSRALRMDRYKQKYREWSVNNRAKIAHYAAARRARKQALTVPGSEQAIEKIYWEAKSEQIASCYWCQRVVEPAERHVDHIVPLVEGGLHHEANLCIACKQCNVRKSGLMPDVWMERLIAGTV